MMLDTHRTPEMMARVLVQYIDDPRKVLSHVKGEFQGTRITLKAIENMIAERRRPSPAPLCFKVQDNAYADSMERSNTAFLNAVASAHPSLIRKVA